MRIWRLARPLASKSDINAPNTQAALYIADNVLTRFSSSTSCSGWLHETAPGRTRPIALLPLFESCNTSRIDWLRTWGPSSNETKS